MRRLLALVVALALLAAAAPANAKRDKPPKPPGQATLDVTMTANLWAVNIAGDRILYTITVTNSGGDDLTSVHVTDERLTVDESFELASGVPLIIESTYEVKQGDIAALGPGDRPGDGPPIANTVTVTTTDPADTVTASETVEVWPVTIECNFDDDGQLLTMSEDYVPCSWDPAPGLWTLTAEPITNKRTKVLLTVRDHFPGNWCKTLEDTGGAISGPIKGPATLDVYFPENGICLAGGRGGETMGVGTLGTYYLVANGDVTVKASGPS